MDFKKYYYGDEELVVFIDESGDELLRDPKNPLFVWGCCIVRGSELRQLRKDWLDVRKVVLGDEAKPLHMRTQARRIGAAKEAVLCQFFAEQSFRRASVAISDKTVFVTGELGFRPIFQIGLSHLRDLMAKLVSGVPSHGASIVFERSKRHQQILERLLPSYRLNMDGIGMPVSWAFLGKDSNEPGLEIADFVAHTTIGFERSGREATSKFAKRHSAIFGDGTKGVSWRVDKCELVNLNRKPVMPGE